MKTKKEDTYEIEVKWEIVTRISIPARLIVADPEDYDEVDEQVLSLICDKDLLQRVDDHTVAFDEDYLSSKGITMEMDVFGDPSPMNTWEMPDWSIVGPERGSEEEPDSTDF